ncbi:hypothetical protein R3P38DRAFT_3377619 [Favolaschia claudopus]|uniref:Uncharacterized protein n=1 Tax=Favolaschia claudopus TaxID=2862362 RepID=A0AAV9ZB18_9AGAR
MLYYACIAPDRGYAAAVVFELDHLDLVLLSDRFETAFSFQLLWLRSTRFGFDSGVETVQTLKLCPFKSGLVISVPERRRKRERGGRLRMSGDCQPTREEHKEGRQQGRLEPAGWWKPIRNKTKAGLGRAGARPDEGGHVIGPDEGPGESEKPGELGKVERSTGDLPESQGMS